MKKLIVSSAIVAVALVAGVSTTQARNINNRVSQASINQYCANKIPGREYRVSITTRSGAVITGEIRCGGAGGTINDRSGNDDNGRFDDNGRDDDNGRFDDNGGEHEKGHNEGHESGGFDMDDDHGSDHDNDD